MGSAWIKRSRSHAWHLLVRALGQGGFAGALTLSSERDQADRRTQRALAAALRPQSAEMVPVRADAFVYAPFRLGNVRYLPLTPRMQARGLHERRRRP